MGGCLQNVKCSCARRLILVLSNGKGCLLELGRPYRSIGPLSHLPPLVLQRLVVLEDLLGASGDVVMPLAHDGRVQPQWRKS